MSRKPRNFDLLSLLTNIVLVFSVLISFSFGFISIWPPAKFSCYFNSEEVGCSNTELLEINTGILLFIFSFLCANYFIEKYKTFREFNDELEILESSLRKMNVVSQIKSLRGYKEWYEEACKLAESADTLFYDASLSSRTWHFDKSRRNKFIKLRNKVFNNKDIDARYLIAIKTRLKSNLYDKYLQESVRLNRVEYENKSYKRKLDGDINRLTDIKTRIDPNNGYINFSSSYLSDIHLDYPLLSFLVVDNKKVLLGFYLSEFQEADINQDYSLLIENEEIANLFVNYFRLLEEKLAIPFVHRSGNKDNDPDLLINELQELLQNFDKAHSFKESDKPHSPEK